MTLDEFNQQLSRLAGQWKSAYSTERARLIYKTVQSLTVHEFSFVVDRFLGYRKEAPLVPEFAEECAKIAERKWSAQKNQHGNVVWLNTRARCNKCSDLGMLRAIHKELGPGPYAFRCDCPAGKQRQVNWPAWEMADQSKYELAGGDT